MNTWHHRKRLKIISERSEALVTAVMFVRFLELRWFSCSDGSLAEEPTFGPERSPRPFLIA